MKGSCNYREAYLSTAEVSEEWHKLGQKPEVIRCAACVCACVCKLVCVCVCLRERDTKAKRKGGRAREKTGDRERSAYNFSSSESTSELCFSLLARLLSRFSAVAGCG